MIKKVGFTGPSTGMTNDQLLQIHMLMGELEQHGAKEAMHGMCEGSDEVFHEQAKGFRFFVIGSPGVTVFGKEWKRSTKCNDCDIILPVRPFISRNHDIVRECDLIIATPAQTKEQERGSGTWSTIRYARSVKKPLAIVWPDGTGVVERLLDGGMEMTLEEFREWL